MVPRYFLLGLICFGCGSCKPRETASRPNQIEGQTRASRDSTLKTPPLVWKAGQKELSALCRQAGVRAKNLRLVIEKEPRVWRFERNPPSESEHPSLLVYAGGRLIKAYPAALGFDPVGDKEKRGDYRTPEGLFYLCGQNPQSQFYLSLRLNYPNAEDARRGLKQNLIDQATANKIVRANRRGAVPPQNTALGGDIMIHGGGIGSNWTWGCIALENAAVKELFDFLPMGTAVEIKAPLR